MDRAFVVAISVTAFETLMVIRLILSLSSGILLQLTLGTIGLGMGAICICCLAMRYHIEIEENRLRLRERMAG